MPPKILLVEDEGLIADDIRRRLERLGYAVPAIASSGEEAVRLARSLSCDLALMDIRLQGAMDGIAAAQRLKEELSLPVVYLTAHADQDTVGRATLTEPLGYILKPIADGNLRSSLQIALYRHRTETRLRRSEEWLSSTLRSIGDGIVATDSDGRVVFLNAVAARLTGWDPPDAQGRALMEVLALLEEPSGEPARNPVFDLWPDESRTYTLVQRSGAAVPVEIACFENRGGGELFGAIVVLRDIRARQESDACRVQSERMAAISALAAGVAAEIRRAPRRIDTLQAGLSLLAAGGSPREETIDVNRGIAQLHDVMRDYLGPSIALHIALDSPGGFIRADLGLFCRTLVGLARRARDVMPRGGTWRVETSVCDLDADDPAARRLGGRWFVRLRCTDSGPVVSPAAAARIFEPAFSGSRFAVSAAYAAVVQTGGSITARGEAGRGTCFEILWPCIGTRTEGPGPTVLLVEEEDDLRRSLSACLEQEGCTVLAAKNARHADWMAAKDSRPPFALVAATEDAALALQFGVPALYLSGYRHDRPAADDALSKPFPIGEFRRRIRAMLP